MLVRWSIEQVCEESIKDPLPIGHNEAVTAVEPLGMLDKQKDEGDKPEVKEAKARPEAQRSGVIGDTCNQARWTRAQQAHYLGQDESATDLFRKPGDSPNNANKFTIEGLDEETPKIAYDLRDIQKDVRKAGNQIEYAKQTLSSFEAPAKLELVNAVYPRRGHEDAYISYPACKAANSEFPELAKRIGEGRNHIDQHLIAATIRLEVAFYKQGADTGQDKYIQEHGHDDGIGEAVSIGPAQMQIRHLGRLVKEFPEQLGRFAGDPARAALKVENAPHFVAGYFSEVIQHLKEGTKPEYIARIGWDGVRQYWREGDLNAALIYAYNPRKDHIDSVKQQLKIIHQNQKL